MHLAARCLIHLTPRSVVSGRRVRGHGVLRWSGGAGLAELGSGRSGTGIEWRARPSSARAGHYAAAGPWPAAAGHRRRGGAQSAVCGSPTRMSRRSQGLVADNLLHRSENIAGAVDEGIAPAAASPEVRSMARSGHPGSVRPAVASSAAPWGRTTCTPTWSASCSGRQSDALPS